MQWISHLAEKMLPGCSEKLSMRWCFLLSLTLAFVAPIGCSTTTIKPIGSTEAVIGEKLSDWYTVSHPTTLFAENPHLVIQVLNLPQQKIEVRSKERVIQEMDGNTSAFIALSSLGFMVTGAYWGATHPMDWGGSDDVNAVATASVVGMAGFFVSVIGMIPVLVLTEHQEERESPNVDVISRLSNTSKPVADVEVTIRIGKQQKTYRTDTNGSVKVNLIKDFNLSRFNANRFISFEVYIPQAFYYRSGFLHFSKEEGLKSQ